MPDPAPAPIDWFLSRFETTTTWAQILVRRLPPPQGFELCHVHDAGASPETLQTLAPHQLRAWADADRFGEFRPLKSAPDLRPGWRCLVRDPAELMAALDDLLPGSVGDAWAHLRGALPIRFEDFAAAQVGRAGILRDLAGPSLAWITAAACHPGACLKHRIWTAADLPPVAAPGPESVPCLEPCPLFQSFARACAETEGKASVPGPFAPDDLATLAAALRHALEHRPPGLRLGNTAAPLHPWRIARLLARHADLWSQADSPTTDPDE